MIRNIVLGALLAACFISAAASNPNEEFFVKTVTFEEGTDSATKIDMAARLVPTPQQMDWQNLELTAFMHFGVNTFTGREWGDGKEDPKIFNPANLDCDQWVKELKDAGFNLVLLTAKHHDGFCLWPTKTTKHSVKSSKWRGGKGDVVGDLRKACDKYGMNMGIYLSPWDRNAPQYGDNDKYNDMFIAQLTELLTNYGTIDEVWFDGANGEGPNGKKQEYDWTRILKTIRELQPQTVTAICGDDVRWVGNEGGVGRTTEWSVTPLTPTSLDGKEGLNKEMGINGMSKDLGSRALIAKANKLYWYPSEVDVSIRPGWFFHPTEAPHSLERLANIYLSSVGRNSVLLLNIPPDTDGRIHASDVARIREFSKWISDNFSNNLCTSTQNGITYTKGSPKANTVVLQEDITKGQRVEEFEVIGLVDGQWKVLTEGTTIGKKRILMFPEENIDALMTVVKSHRGDKVNLLPIELYNVTMPKESDAPAISLPLADKSTWKETASGNTYTVDMGKKTPVTGFIYTPPTGSDKSGMIFKYKFETSANGKTWTEIPLSGEFSNILHNPIPQTVYLPSMTDARYIRLTSLESADGSDGMAIDNFEIITK